MHTINFFVLTDNSCLLVSHYILVVNSNHQALKQCQIVQPNSNRETVTRCLPKMINSNNRLLDVLTWKLGDQYTIFLSLNQLNTPIIMLIRLTVNSNRQAVTIRLTKTQLKILTYLSNIKSLTPIYEIRSKLINTLNRYSRDFTIKIWLEAHLHLVNIDWPHKSQLTANDIHYQASI